MERKESDSYLEKLFNYVKNLKIKKYVNFYSILFE